MEIIRTYKKKWNIYCLNKRKMKIENEKKDIELKKITMMIY